VISTALADVGCDDLPRNGAFVLGAIARSGAPLSDVIEGLGVSKQAGGALVDTLVSRSYLDRTIDPHHLPLAFTHPDFVTANALVPPAGDPMIIDWAGAGVAPRLWTLAFLLWSAGLSGPRHIDAAVQGYRQHVSLDPAELDRLEPGRRGPAADLRRVELCDWSSTAS